MLVLVDEAGYIKDLCANTHRCFRRGAKLSKYNPDLCSVLTSYSRSVLGPQSRSEQALEAGSSPDPHLARKVQAFAQVLGSRFCSELASELLEPKLYNIRIDCHKNLPTRSLFFALRISRLETPHADLPEKEPISILQSFFKRRVSVEVRHNHIHMNWRKKVADHHTFRHARFDFSSKYAQQRVDSTYSQMPCTPSTTRMVGAVFNVTKFNEALRAMSPDRNESGGMFHLDAYRESEEKNEQQVTNLRALVFSASAQESALVKHSRFIHHNINFKGIKRTVFCVACPFLLQLLLLGYLYARETQNYVRLQGISAEVSLLDATGYLSWVVNLEVQYVLMKRMLAEQLLEDAQMADYGIPSLRTHLDSLMAEPEMQNQLTLNLQRTSLGLSKSSFRQFYGAGLLDQSRVRILTHVADRTPAFLFVEMSGYDGARLAQQSLNQVFRDPSLVGRERLGSVAELRRSASEEVARWNILNPIHQYVERSRLESPVAQTQASAIDRIEEAIQLSSRLPFLLALVSTAVLLLAYIAGYCLYRNHAAKVARKFFTFDVADADQSTQLREELDSLVSSTEKFFEFLKYESLEEPSPLQKQTDEEPGSHSPASQHKQHASKQSLTVLPRSLKKQQRASRETSHQRFELECGCLAASFLGYLMLAQLFATSRYLVMVNRSEPILHLLQAFRNSIEVYDSFVSLNMCLCELYLWNDETRIGFRRPSDFYRLRRDRLLQRDLAAMARLSSGSSEAAAFYRRLTQTQMAEVLRLADDDKQPLPAVEAAIAGAALKPMAGFLQQYAVVCDQMVLEWQLADSAEQRKNLLGQPQYSSLLAYAVFNSLGSGDAMYYFLVYPTYTELQRRTGQIAATLDLSNLVSLAVFLLLVVLLGCPVVRMFHRAFLAQYLAVYCVPLRSLDSHRQMKQACKLAEQNKRFAYF